MTIVRVRRKHRWWKRLLRMSGPLPIGLILLTLCLALGVAGVVMWVGR